MNERSKACDISYKTKHIVWERDEHCCILCGNPQAMPNAHYIPRSQGGLGIEQNIVTLCWRCHYAYDQTDQRNEIKPLIEKYLRRCYKNWNEKNLIYKKGENNNG